MKMKSRSYYRDGKIVRVIVFEDAERRAVKAPPVDVLQAKLAEAVIAENYETAAVIRDEIKKITSSKLGALA